jgi:hypothetical protein
VGDVHCIIEAMIGKGGPVTLQPPQLLGVPEVRVEMCLRCLVLQCVGDVFWVRFVCCTAVVLQ